jgi:hypothetical protein
MPLTRIDQADFVFDQSVVSTSCWRDENGNPTTTPSFVPQTVSYTVSNSTGNVTNYYIGNPANLQFSLTTADKNGSLYEQAVYGAIRNLVYGDKNADFNWGGYSGRFGIWAVSKHCLQHSLIPGSLKLGNLTDNSKMSPPQILNCGRAYKLVVGSSLPGGGFSYGIGTGDSGLFLPDIGIILLSSSGPLAFEFSLSSGIALPTNHVFIRARNAQYNYSTNPSFISGSSGYLIHKDWYENPQTYITTVGLYNDNNELMATAKLPRPYNKNFNNELLIHVGLNF